MGIMPKRNHLLSLSTTLAAIVALVVLFAGCATTVTPSVVKVAIVGGNVSMNVGTTKKLTATVTVLGGAAKTVTWKSDTTAVATVASDGTVTASSTKTGTAKITATSTVDKTKSATITVTVVPAGAPTINSFTASPTSIGAGGTTTLSWDVSGAASLSLSDGTNAITIAQTPTGTVDVTPTQTGTVTYTLTATNSQGSVTDTADVTVVPAPTITNLQAPIGMGSTVDLSWSATNATTFDIYAVLNTDSTDQQLIESGVTGTTATIDIPASTRQTIRVVANGAGGTAHASVALTNVVTSSADYDPYMLQGFTPETPVPGTLRYEIANAASGSIIGFASDITSINISGVDIYNPPGGPDSHLVIRDDVTVSGPTAGVTLTGVSPAPSGTPAADAFTWESRMILVAPGVTAQLDHLTIQGGTFIYNGAGIFNDGTLTVSNSTVTGNRAWELGGGIFNGAGAALTLTNSHIDANQAITLDSEMGTVFDIRSDPTYTTTPSDGGYGAGLYNNGGTVTVNNTSFDSNVAKYSGGGIYNASGTMTMTASPISNNTADYSTYSHTLSAFAYGGGAYNAGDFSFTGADITGNTVSDLGGGFALATNGTATLSNVNFDGNSADWGGAIEHYYCTVPTNLTTDATVTFGTNTATSGNPDIDTNDTCAAPATVSLYGTHPAMEMIPGMKTQPQR